MNWYSFKSKDGKIRGYYSAKSKLEVARFAGYPISGLHMERVVWSGERFIKNESQMD